MSDGRTLVRRTSQAGSARGSGAREPDTPRARSACATRWPAFAVHRRRRTERQHPAGPHGRPVPGGVLGGRAAADLAAGPQGQRLLRLPYSVPRMPVLVSGRRGGVRRLAEPRPRSAGRDATDPRPALIVRRQHPGPSVRREWSRETGRDRSVHLRAPVAPGRHQDGVGCRRHRGLVEVLDARPLVAAHPRARPPPGTAAARQPGRGVLLATRREGQQERGRSPVPAPRAGGRGGIGPSVPPGALT